MAARRELTAAWITPHRLSLAVLVSMLATNFDPFSSPEYVQLALYLVEEVHSVVSREKSLFELADELDALEEELGGDLDDENRPQSLAESLVDRLDEMADGGDGGLDGLFVFLSELELLSPPPHRAEDAAGEPKLEPQSVLGVFVRQVSVAFRAQPFEALCRLFDNLGDYLGDFQEERSFLNQSLANSEMSMEPPQLTPSAPTVAQLHQHIHEHAQRLEMSAAPLSMEALADEIADMLAQVHDQPKLYYLRFLYCIRSRDFEASLESLHKYFDLISGPRTIQFAALNLAALHLLFGHTDEAMEAIRETVRVAQQSNDASALSHAVSWLLRVINAQDESRTAVARPQAHGGAEQTSEVQVLRRAYASASESEQPHLASLTLLAQAKHVMKHGVNAAPSLQQGAQAPLPAAVWACVEASRRLERETAAAGLVEAGDCAQLEPTEGGAGNQHALIAALWDKLGHTTLSHAMATLQLAHCTDGAPRGDTAAVACSLALVAAEEGRMDDAIDQVREVARSAPAPDPLVPRTLYSMMGERALRLGDTKVAAIMAASLASLASSSGTQRLGDDAKLLQARINLRENKLFEAVAGASELVYLQHCRGQQAESVRPLLLLAEVYGEADSPISALPYVLSALSLCEAHCMDGAAAYATMTLAELQLRLGSPRKALALLESIMPQVLEHCPPALRAQTAVLLARCNIGLAADLGSGSGGAAAAQQLLENAIGSLRDAQPVFEELGQLARATEGWYLQAHVYQLLGIREERNRCSAQFCKSTGAGAQGQQLELGDGPVLDEILALAASA